MPLASDVKKNRWAAVEAIDAVPTFTRVGKGVGFGSLRTSRGLEASEARLPGASQRRVVTSDRGNSHPGKSVSSPSRAPVEAAMPLASPVGGRSKASPQRQAPQTELFGAARPLELIGPSEKSASNPMKVLWTAGMGTRTMPRPLTAKELARRRMKAPPLRTNNHYPTGPIIVIDDDLALAASRAAVSGHSAHHVPGSRPTSSSSFAPGNRTGPQSWAGGRLNMEGPGPIYVPEETGFLLQQQRRGTPNGSRSIALMPRSGVGVPVVGREPRFAPGMNSYVTMSSPDVSPGAFAYDVTWADDLIMPARVTPATFKPRRAPGGMNYLATKADGPAAKYDKVTGRDLETLSTRSATPSIRIGSAVRAQPATGDFIFMSAPPTSTGQSRPYDPRSPPGTGHHTHNAFGDFSDTGSVSVGQGQSTR